MRYKGYFVDDTESDKIYASLLSVKGDEGLSIDYLPVSEAAELAGFIFDSSPDMVALDFRLDENPDMLEPKYAYKGGGLAQLLRDKASSNPENDFPIVLVSAEEKFDHFYRPDSTAHDLFDRTYGKEYVSDHREQIRKEILALCDGYKILKSVWEAGSDRLSIFGLSGAERKIVEVQELRHGIVLAAAPHIASRTILRDVIDRPGLLLSDNDVSARLGLDDIGLLVPFLIDAGLKYEGIFHNGWRRWWAHRFDVWAEGIFGRRPINLTGLERAQFLNEKYSVDVASALSSWNNSSEERFAFSCASCRRPTEVRHSLAAFDPKAPRYGQRRRICWDCIQTERYLSLQLNIDDIDADLINEIKTKKRE